MFKSLFQPFHLFISGATGKDRQEKRLLAQQLMRVQAEYDRLERDMDELLSYTDEETEKLNINGEKLRSQLKQARADNQELRQRNEALENRVIFLEQQIQVLQTHKNALKKNHKKSHKAPLTNPRNSSRQRARQPLAGSQRETSSPGSAASIDLSRIQLALVGGHDTTRREVTKELSSKHGLKRCVEVPPHSVASHNRHQIKDKISNCDLIVIITTHIDHSVTQSVMKLKNTDMLSGQVFRVSCHGKSGVVREILDYASTHLAPLIEADRLEEAI